jgi:CheY-like chemotaxis protein
MQQDKPRVMVVEDDDDIRDSLIDVLHDFGYLTSSASHGRDALDQLHDGSPRPTLILLDLMMPVMDGPAFREQQLKSPELAGIPVVVISAFHDLERIIASLQPAAYLAKPIDVARLLQLVERYAACA